MTNETHKTALELFGDDAAKIAKAGNAAANAQADSIAHFVQAVLDAEQGGNNPKLKATFKDGKGKEARKVTHVIDKAFLVEYAQGKLSDEQIKRIMPTLRELTPAHKAAFEAYEATKTWTAAEKIDFAAHISRLKADLDMFESKSARTTAWRPIYFAAVLFADPELDPTSVEVKAKDRKSEVTVMVTPRKMVEGEWIEGKPVRRALSHKNVSDRLDAIKAANGVKPAKRKPRQAVNAPAVAKPSAHTGVTITPESFRRGGEARNALADAWKADAQMLTAAYDAEVTLTAKERRALIDRILAECAMLDKEGMADLRKGMAKLG